MIVTATQKQIPISPRKLQLVVASVKHLNPQAAVELLGHSNLRAATPVAKTIKQALANATNTKIDPAVLRFKELVINKGFAIKRVRFSGRGRVKPYRKTRSHLTVKLESTSPIPTTKPTQIKNKSKSV